MKDYHALNPNPSPPVGYVDSVDLISLKIYKLSILSHSKKKIRMLSKKPTESTEPTERLRFGFRAQ